MVDFSYFLPRLSRYSIWVSSLRSPHEKLTSEASTRTSSRVAPELTPTGEVMVAGGVLD